MKDVIKNFLWATLLIALQILVFNQINIFGLGLVFVYVLFLLTIPISVKHTYFMLIAFFSGLVVDIFTHSYGINAAAATLIAFLRPSVMKLFFSKEELEYRVGMFVRFSVDYYKYAVTIIFLYSFTVFSLEALSWSLISIILIKTLISTITTTIFIFFIQVIFLKKYNERYF